MVALHDGVHSPPTHEDPLAHCVASAHWSWGFTHVPLKHFAPGASQPLSLEHVDVAPGMTAVQLAAPFSSLHTKFEGHPDVAQVPEWHLLSAPQVEPLGQSDGFVHDVIAGVGGGGAGSG